MPEIKLTLYFILIVNIMINIIFCLGSDNPVVQCVDRSGAGRTHADAEQGKLYSSDATQ